MKERIDSIMFQSPFTYRPCGLVQRWGLNAPQLEGICLISTRFQGKGEIEAVYMFQSPLGDLFNFYRRSDICIYRFWNPFRFSPL